jgi:Asp-tRNA(Asn)/Glu-tRNA(Gln) amidotransferase A subunit family amidase
MTSVDSGTALAQDASSYDEPTVPEAIERIGARNPELRAFVSTRFEQALAEHRERMQEAPRSALHDVPFSLKDTWEVAGEVTTGGSYRYRDRISRESAPIYAALRRAGAVLVGKTNLSDLMLVPESASYVGGVGCNPHDVTRTCGGSSGGAAAAVAAGMVAFDWGSDVGGSIRMPAGYCGVLGLRLSTETWPMTGSFPSLPQSLAWMNGQGPITATIGRMRDVLRVAAPTMRTKPELAFGLRGAVLYGPGRARGQWPTFVEEVGPAMRAALEGMSVSREHGLLDPVRARNVAGAMWASHFEDLLASDVLTLGEGLRAVVAALVARGRFGDRRFHPHTAAVLGLIALGRVSLYRNRVKAERDTESFRSQVRELWDRGLLVVAPTTAWPAPRHGGTFLNFGVQTFTMPGNLADATALALPFGRFPDGMPRSIQIWGPPGSEDVVLDVAARVLREGPARDRFRALSS